VTILGSRLLPVPNKRGLLTTRLSRLQWLRQRLEVHLLRVGSRRAGFLAIPCSSSRLRDPNAAFSEKANTIPHLTQTGCREDQGHRGAPLARCRESGSDVGRRRQAPKQLPMCLLFTIKRPSRFRPPSTTKRRALVPASFAASLRPQGLDMIVLLGRRKKAGPCTGRVERRQFCNTNNPAESRRQPSLVFA